MDPIAAKKLKLEEAARRRQAGTNSDPPSRSASSAPLAPSAPSTAGPPVAPPDSGSPASDTMECPQCAETIKKRAKICRFCRCDPHAAGRLGEAADDQTDRDDHDGDLDDGGAQDGDINDSDEQEGDLDDDDLSFLDETPEATPAALPTEHFASAAIEDEATLLRKEQRALGMRDCASCGGVFMPSSLSYSVCDGCNPVVLAARGGSEVPLPAPPKPKPPRDVPPPPPLTRKEAEEARRENERRIVKWLFVGLGVLILLVILFVTIRRWNVRRREAEEVRLKEEMAADARRSEEEIAESKRRAKERRTNRATETEAAHSDADMKRRMMAALRDIVVPGDQQYILPIGVVGPRPTLMIEGKTNRKLLLDAGTRLSIETESTLALLENIAGNDIFYVVRVTSGSEEGRWGMVSADAVGIDAEDLMRSLRNQ